MHPERGNYYADDNLLRLKSANLIDFFLFLFNFIDKAHIIFPKTDKNSGKVLFKVEENVNILSLPFPEIKGTIFNKIVATVKFIRSLIKKETLSIIKSADYSVSAGYTFTGIIFGFVRTSFCKKKHSFIIRGERSKTVELSSRKLVNKKFALLRIYFYKKLMIYLLESGEAELWFQGQEDYDKYMIESSMEARNRLFLLNAVLRELPCSDRKNEQRKIYDIIYLGRITIEKGVLDLIKAVSIIASNGLYVSVIIVGEGPDMIYANKLTKKLELNNMIKFIGFVSSKKEIAKLLSSAKLFVLPSYTEGISRSMVESMYLGTPVLVTPVGGIKDAIIDGLNGFLVDPFSPKKLAEKIIAILASIEKEETDQIVNVARKNSEKYSFKSRAKYFLENSINNPKR